MNNPSGQPTRSNNLPASERVGVRPQVQGGLGKNMPTAEKAKEIQIPNLPQTATEKMAIEFLVKLRGIKVYQGKLPELTAPLTKEESDRLHQAYSKFIASTTKAIFLTQLQHLFSMTEDKEGQPIEVLPRETVIRAYQRILCHPVENPQKYREYVNLLPVLSVKLPNVAPLNEPQKQQLMQTVSLEVSLVHILRFLYTTPEVTYDKVVEETKEPQDLSKLRPVGNQKGYLNLAAADNFLMAFFPTDEQKRKQITQRALLVVKGTSVPNMPANIIENWAQKNAKHREEQLAALKSTPVERPRLPQSPQVPKTTKTTETVKAPTVDELHDHMDRSLAVAKNSEERKGVRRALEPQNIRKLSNTINFKRQLEDILSTTMSKEAAMELALGLIGPLQLTVEFYRTLVAKGIIKQDDTYLKSWQKARDKEREAKEKAEEEERVLAKYLEEENRKKMRDMEKEVEEMIQNYRNANAKPPLVPNEDKFLAAIARPGNSKRARENVADASLWILLSQTLSARIDKWCAGSVGLGKQVVLNTDFLFSQIFSMEVISVESTSKDMRMFLTYLSNLDAGIQDENLYKYFVQRGLKRLRGGEKQEELAEREKILQERVQALADLPDKLSQQTVSTVEVMEVLKSLRGLLRIERTLEREMRDLEGPLNKKLLEAKEAEHKQLQENIAEKAHQFIYLLLLGTQNILINIFNEYKKDNNMNFDTAIGYEERRKAHALEVAKQKAIERLNISAYNKYTG